MLKSLLAGSRRGAALLPAERRCTTASWASGSAGKRQTRNVKQTTRYTSGLPSAYKRQPAADNNGAAIREGRAKLGGGGKYPRQLVFICSGLGTVPHCGGCRRFIEPVSPRLCIKTFLSSAGGWCAKGKGRFFRKAIYFFTFASLASKRARFLIPCHRQTV